MGEGRGDNNLVSRVFSLAWGRSFPAPPPSKGKDPGNEVGVIVGCSVLSNPKGY